jgi:hypothetical protein
MLISKVVRCFSKKKEFFTGRPIWNPSKDAKEEKEPQEAPPVESTVRIMFKKQEKITQARQGLFLDALKAPSKNTKDAAEKLEYWKSQPESA